MRFRIPLLLSAAILVVANPALAQESNMVVGNVRVVKVDGTAWQIIGGNGQRERLNEGDFLRQGNTVVTDSRSTVLLLFQNGSTINLQPGTKFSIAQFLHDPFETERVDYRKISSEPSRSTTRVEVKEGTITAKIPKLQRASSYTIATPLGTAGIRGTVVTVSVNPNAATFVVTEGSVQITKGGQTFFAGADAGQQGDTRTVSADGQQNVSVSSDPNYTPPAGQTQGLIQQAQQFSANAGQSIPQNPFVGAPQQQAGSGNTQSGSPTDAGTDGGGGTGGSGGGSPPALPGGFGGGGGGGGGGGSTGGGSQYSTR